MEISRTDFRSLLSLALLAVVVPHPATAQTATATHAPTPETLRDGQHDFDFEIGTWRTQLKRLVDSRSGSKTGSTRARCCLQPFASVTRNITAATVARRFT